MAKKPKLCSCGCGLKAERTGRSFKVACPFCHAGCFATASIMAAGGFKCGRCDAALEPVCMYDAARIGEEVLTAHPAYREMAERELVRAYKAARKVNGSKPVGQCGGCSAPIWSTNHRCRCGFENDIRGRRNVGGYAIPF